MDLRKVTMADSVVEIGDYAFNQNYSLQNIEFSKNLKKIGDVAFYETGLINISFPKSLKIIGDSAFEETPWVENATDEFLIRNNILFKYNGNKKNVVIPDGVTTIMNDVFFEKKIKSVTMPDSVKYIHSLAFCKCYELTSIKLSPSIISIGNYAFSNCSKLTKITLPSNLKTIGDEAFSNTGLKSIVIPEGVTTIGHMAFDWCTSLEKFTLASTVKNFGYSIFYNTDIKKFIIANGTKKLVYIEGINNLVVPNSVVTFDSAYSKWGNNVTFTCKKDSKAYKFAKKNNIKIKLMK